MIDKAGYKLLEPNLATKDEDETEYGDGETECEVEVEQFFLSPSATFDHRSSYIKTTPSLSLGLPQLRIILCFTSILLVVIFIAHLSTNDRNGTSHHKQTPTSIRSTPLYAQMSNIDIDHSSASNNEELTALAKAPLQISTNKPLQYATLSPVPSTARKSNFTTGENNMPEFDSYLSSVLQGRNSQNPSIELIDDLHVPIEQVMDPSGQGIHGKVHESNSSVGENTASAVTMSRWWITGYRDRNNYITLTNYIRAMNSFKPNSSVTLTSQATTEYMYHSLELCKRWDGPISIAVFCPGKELLVAVTLIKYMRQCLPAPLSACIRDKVTWHLVYNKVHGPSEIVEYPKKYLDTSNYPLFVHQDQCPKLRGPEPIDNIKQLEEELSKRNNVYSPTYRQQFKLTYPINVLRNVARLAAYTHYVLALDIELYPSINLVPTFIDYIQKHDVRREYKEVLKGNTSVNFIFTLPIFEVESKCQPPKTKPELIKMFENREAVFFHKWVCDACQNFPNRLDWLQKDVFNSTYLSDSDDHSDMELKIFEVTQRDKNRDSWEPIFIGTNNDPLYDDRLSWDGRRDKMAQMYEMCLKDYYLFILGNAFLVHAPGIKHIDRSDTMKRLDYIKKNNAIYDDTIANLRKQYKDSSNLNKC